MISEVTLESLEAMVHLEKKQHSASSHIFPPTSPPPPHPPPKIPHTRSNGAFSQDVISKQCFAHSNKARIGLLSVDLHSVLTTPPSVPSMQSTPIDELLFYLMTAWKGYCLFLYKVLFLLVQCLFSILNLPWLFVLSNSKY